MRKAIATPGQQRAEQVNKRRRLEVRLIGKSLILAAVAAGSAAALADDEDVVDYRIHVMKTLGEQLGAVEMILARKAPADGLAAHMQVIAIAATQVRKAFEPRLPGGNSKPEVWSNWADFSKRIDALVASSDQLAKAAKDGSAAAIGPRIKSTLDCESCHKIYMLPPKP
jgi:cytochrome c556